MEWGSVADWVAVLIALIGLIGWARIRKLFSVRGSRGWKAFKEGTTTALWLTSAMLVAGVVTSLIDNSGGDIVEGLVYFIADQLFSISIFVIVVPIVMAIHTYHNPED